MVNEIIRKEIKDIIENHIDSCINYEWNGSDFNHMVLTHCQDQNESLFDDVELEDKEPTIQFDNELYQKFLNHLTEFIHSGMSVTKNNEYVTN
jgi:hypothetical protein